MTEKIHSDVETAGYSYKDEREIAPGSRHIAEKRDVFGNEEDHQIKYKTLSWQLVAVLMIAEIVSNGMLSLPSSGGVVGVSDLLIKFERQLKPLDSLFPMLFSSW